MAGKIVSYIFKGDIGDLKAKMTAAGHSVGKLADDLTKADKESAKFRQGLTSVGDTAGKIGLVAAAGVGAIVTATARFDKAMSNVAATGDEARGSLDKLREAAIRAGADTAFSASEAAGGIENLLKAGVAAGDVLGGGLTGALDLAAAGEMEVADAAEVAATAMTQFRLEGSQVPHIADLLAAAAGKAQGDVSDMAMALKQSGLVASQMGLSIEETTGTLAAFASAGLLGSDAGTSLRTMLLRLANPAGESAKLMSSLGIEAYNANGAFIGMEELARQLTVAFEGKSQAERDSAMATIFGSDAIRAASVLYQQGAEGVADWTAKVDDAGFAAETAATRMDNLMGDLEKLGGSLETALIGSGGSSQGILRELVQNLDDVVGAYNDLPPAAQSATTAFLGVTAVAGGGLWAFSKIVTGVSDMRSALVNLGTSAEGAGRHMKSAAAAAGAIAGAAIAGQVIDSWDDAALSARSLELSLRGLAEGQVNAALRDMSIGVDTFGDALKRAAYSDIDWLSTADEIEAVDEALASLSDHDPGEAARAFQTIMREGKAAGLSVKEITALFPEYAAAQEMAAQAAEDGADATDSYAGAVEGSVGPIEAANDALTENIDLMREQRSAALEAANAEIGYQAALDDARAAIKENGKAWDITTEKGRANREELYAVAAGWNNLSSAAKNAPGAHAAARKSFIDLAMDMGATRKQAQNLARELLELPDKKVKVTADTSQAESAIGLVASKLASLDGRQARTYITTVYDQAGFQTRGGLQRAAGGPVYGPGTATSDSIPALLSNGEYVIKAAAVDKYGIDTFHKLNAMRLASGGPVGMAAGGSVDERLDILRIQQQINDLRRDLAKDGKDSLKGIARSIAALELRSAQADLRAARRAPIRAGREQMGALRSIELDVEGGASVAETREALREFRADVREAGGVWTKQMANTAHRLIDLAKATNRTERSLEKETEQRDRLADKLDDEIRALEQLRDTMAAYSQSVAGNFLNDPFNGAYSMKAAGGSAAAPVDDAALAAARAALSDAEGRLAGIRGSSMDPLQRSYLASKAVAEVAEYRSQVEQLDRGTKALGEMGDEAETMVSGLDAMREALVRDTEAAREFAASLATLSANGLNAGLFQQLAASGDVATAGQLAGLGAGGLAEINALWEQREQAAAQVATYATQQVFGAQLDAATQAVMLTEQTLAKQDRTIERLNNRLEKLGDRVENGAVRGIKALEPQIGRIEQAIRGQARQLQELQRAGKKGRN